MKIGIDIRALMDKNYSGVSEYTFNLLTEIFKIDKTNQYKLFYNSGHDVSGQMPQFKGENIEIIHTRYPNKLFNNVMQRILGWPKLDSLLGVDFFFMPNIGFASLSKERRKIITIHDLSFLRYPEFFSGKRRAWHNLINIKKFLKKFDQIIAVSQNTKNDIINLCDINSDKIKVIHLGISSEYRKISPQEQPVEFARVKEKYKLPEKFIFFLGTLEPRKNVDGLIRAYNLLRAEKKDFPEIKLVLAGARGWKYKNIFEEHEKSKYKNDIIFLDYVDTADKVYLYNSAEVFAYPSFYEGFGLPPLEAMACGTPVLTGNSSSLPEIVGKGAVLINPRNEGEIAAGLDALLKNQNLRQEIIALGQKNIERFSWEKCARKHIAEFTK